MCPRCKTQMIGIQYIDPTERIVPEEHQYDGISEWRCIKCGYREGRWSHRELKGDDDYERKYGIEC